MRLPALRRQLLARVVGMVGTTDAMVAGLSLIDDTAEPQVPYEIWKQVEATFVEHKPSSAVSNAYTLAPRSANSIRNKLFEMTATDARRKDSASSLLAQLRCGVWNMEDLTMSLGIRCCNVN
jgi:hypothetical protein